MIKGGTADKAVPDFDMDRPRPFWIIITKFGYAVGYFTDRELCLIGSIIRLAELHVPCSVLGFRGWIVLAEPRELLFHPTRGHPRHGMTS